jgi:sulfate permease, SulP family
LLIVLLVAAPLASYVPMVLAAILMFVAWNMDAWREIPDLLKLSKADIAVWLVTFALTVLAYLIVAVEVGMILAALLLFIRNVSRTTTVSEVTEDDVEGGRLRILQDKNLRAHSRRPRAAREIYTGLAPAGAPGSALLSAS